MMGWRRRSGENGAGDPGGDLEIDEKSVFESGGNFGKFNYPRLYGNAIFEVCVVRGT